MRKFQIFPQRIYGESPKNRTSNSELSEKKRRKQFRRFCLILSQVNLLNQIYKSIDV